MMTLDLIVKVTLLLAVVTVVRFLGNPALRHFARSLSLGAILALPILVAILPAHRLEILPRSAPVESPSASSDAQQGVASPAPSNAKAVIDPTVPTETEALSWATLLWGAGIVACLARLAVGLFGLVRYRGVPFHRPDVDLDELASRVDLRTAPTVRLAASHDLATAMTWGVITPVVQLPMDAREWSQERLEAVLLHEFAHVRRRDFLSGLLGQLACALYWFHPFVWLSARAARADAESAADDAVLQSGIRPSSYAAELLGLAADLGKRRQVPLSLGVTIMTEPKIENRLRSVLSSRALRRGMTRPEGLALIAVALLTVPALAGLRAVATERTPQERTEALIHAKGIALATVMYAQDYDDHFPNASSTAVAWKGIEPYAKSLKSQFEKPITGVGNLTYNTHLSQVSVMAIPSPAETPLWVERLANPKEPFVVAFVDGHVKIVRGDRRLTVEKALRARFPTRPLPRIVPANEARRSGGVGN